MSGRCLVAAGRLSTASATALSTPQQPHAEPALQPTSNPVPTHQTCMLKHHWTCKHMPQLVMSSPQQQPNAEHMSQPWHNKSCVLQHPRVKPHGSSNDVHCRGDVGSWVREAAMGVLPDSLALMYALQPNQDTQHTVRLLQALLKQAVERIARLREVHHSCNFLAACLGFEYMHGFAVVSLSPPALRRQCFA